jgi:ABC-type amino acid transport substrate-binding protein
VRPSSRSFAGLCALVAVLFVGMAGAASLDEIRAKGVLKVAVYNAFPPFHANGKGIDADLAQLLADALGVKLSLLPFDAAEKMSDDLRNMVWKGHYTGYGPADVMLHVPVAPGLKNTNKRVIILAPYYFERLALAYDPQRVPQPNDVTVFEHEPIGAEDSSISSFLLLGADGGSVRGQVHHYKSPFEALDDLRQGKLAAVLAQRSEVEAAVGTNASLKIADGPFPADFRTSWPVGLAVSADNAPLGEALAKAIEAMKADGRLTEIFAHHNVSWRAP